VIFANYGNKMRIIQAFFLFLFFCVFTNIAERSPYSNDVAYFFEKSF